jgi:hypothetical protein
MQPGSRGNKLRPAVKVTRAEVTIETKRVLIIHRRGSLLEGWRARCGKYVRVIGMEEAALAGPSLQAIRHQLEAGRLHFTTVAGELSYLCRDSLLD